ncbi:MAG: ATP-binding protein [Candidatus Acidiferrum sp.]
MDLDKILHGQKNFGEMEDADIEQFLKAKAFGAEHLNLEFKGQFPQKSSGKFDMREICKYIVGFSNEEGGIVIYGVSDDIKMPTATFPAYVPGLTKHPSTEDLSQWVRERIHPLVSSPAIRFFQACGKRIAVLKIPPGVNKPYCYCEEPTRAVTYFKKTAGGITELSPDEIREFHRTHIIDQARRVLRSPERESGGGSALEPASLRNHKSLILQKLENVNDYGLVRFCVWPSVPVDIPVDRLREFMEYHRFRFSETLRYSPNVEFFQNGVSVGYFPRSIRKDIKSTCRTTLYRDGLIAFDAQVDTFMEGTRTLHAGWLCYELQRHLQLVKALLKDQEVSEIHVVLDFAHTEEFAMAMDLRWSEGHYTPHEPIHRDVELSAIHDHDGDKRNIVMNVVRDIIDEIYRIFGFSKAGSPKLWDENEYLLYVKGLENQR